MDEMVTREQTGLSARDESKVVDSLVLRGDWSGLGPAERARAYMAVCKQHGLNPLSQPFAFLRLNGKEVLYATRGATDQLAAMHRVNRKIIDGPRIVDICGTKVALCTAEASLPNGRTETATATLPVVDPVNLFMKLETKAKRRATLSILGLGVMDETEIGTIPAGVQEPGGGVDLERAGDPVDVEAEESAEPQAHPLAAFYAGLSDLADPTAGALLWHEHRAALNAAEGTDRPAAWDALVKRLVTFGGGVASVTAAKNFLKGKLAELGPKPAPAVVATPVEPQPAAPPVEAPAPEAAPVEASTEPAAAPFVEQLARCATLDAVATLWLAAREDIAQGTKADQAAAWGAAVERLAVIQHCAPSKALGVLLSKRIKILAGEEPDPNGPKGSATHDGAPLSDVHGSGEASANDTTAAQARHVVLDTDLSHITIAGTWRETEAGWREHLTEMTARKRVEASVGCNGAALGPRFLMLAAERIVALDDAARAPGSLRLTVHGVLQTLERRALDGSRARSAHAAQQAA